MAPAKDSVTAWYARGDKVPSNAVLFSGHNPGNPYHYLSSFYMEQLEDANRITYTCGEAYFQAGKAWLVKDRAKFMQIAHARSGLEARKLGNAIKELPVARWDEISQRVMADALFFKFSHNAEIRKKLISTGNKVLIEARDNRAWASGMKTAKATAKTPISEWRGRNKLGEELMRMGDVAPPNSQSHHESVHVTPPPSSPTHDGLGHITPVASPPVVDEQVNEPDEAGGAGDDEMMEPNPLEKDGDQDRPPDSGDLEPSDAPEDVIMEDHDEADPTSDLAPPKLNLKVFKIAGTPVPKNEKKRKCDGESEEPRKKVKVIPANKTLDL